MLETNFVGIKVAQYFVRLITCGHQCTAENWD